MNKVKLTPQQVSIIQGKNSDARGAVIVLEAYINLLNEAYYDGMDLKDLHLLALEEASDRMVECFWNMVEFWQECGIY